MSEERSKDGETEAGSSDVREELSRAYLLVGWGQIDAAVDICDDVDRRLSGAHPLPPTLAGGFLVSAGRTGEGLRRLRETVRRFPEAPISRIQFAEACFLAGRRRQGERSMEQARELLENASTEYRQWFESLAAVWMGPTPPDTEGLPVGPV